MTISRRDRYLAEFHPKLTAKYRYVSSKYRALVDEKWPLVRKLATGAEILGDLSFCEIHVATPCNLSCTFCRGMIRDVPKEQPMIDREHLLKIVDDVYAMNPKCFIRISGTIGEPTVHPHIVDVCARINHHGLSWGLTTNGLRLDTPGLGDQLLSASYLHVSLDAGSDETYQQLKNGRAGDYSKVITNIRQFSRLKGSASAPDIVLSFLLQSQNYRELRPLSAELESVGIDTFEIKCQHYDPRRGMSDEAIEEAYRLIRELQNDFASRAEAPYVMIAVQSEAEALQKSHDQPLMDFSRCYANVLGLNSVIDPNGNLQPCCQYFGPTLPSQGTTEDGLKEIWVGSERKSALADDPRDLCSSCSPSDDFINRFVSFLIEGQKEDSHFLDWVETQLKVDHS